MARYEKLISIVLDGVLQAFVYIRLYVCWGAVGRRKPFLKGFSLALDKRDGRRGRSASSGIGPAEPARRKCQLLWISWGQQIGRVMC